MSLRASTTRTSTARTPVIPVIVAPGLLALEPAMLASSPAFARIAAWSGVQRQEAGTESSMLALAGRLGAGAAALQARGSGLCGAGAHWLIADPVSLVAGRDDVTLATRVTDLDAPTAARLVARLNRHFAADALEWHAPQPDRWLVRLNDAPQMSSVATGVALGGSLYAHRPQGRDARRFERHANEVQMLFHEVPENAERAARGLVEVNGVWLFGEAGGGAAAPPVRADALADAGSLADLARGIAGASGGATRALDAIDAIDRDAPGVALVVLPTFAPANFADIERGVVAKLVQRVVAGTLGGLEVIADGAGTWRWTMTRPGWITRVRSAHSTRRFVIPR